MLENNFTEEAGVPRNTQLTSSEILLVIILSNVEGDFQFSRLTLFFAELIPEVAGYNKLGTSGARLLTDSQLAPLAI